MSDFANLRDGGRLLGRVLAPLVPGLVEPVLVPALPNGVPVVLGIRETLAVPVVPLPVERSADGAVVRPLPDLAGRTVIVVDDGVETGTVARAAVPAMRRSGVARLVLAVPVCPQEALADLGQRYDDVVAVVRPMERRSLTWHYADFDTVDEAEARRLLADIPA